MEWIMGALSFVCGIGFGLLAMPVIAPSAARRQVKKINPDLLPTKVVCPLPPLPAMPPPPPLISEYAPRPTRAAGVRKSPSTEKLMAVWWQAKIDSVARAPLHQTAADDALQPRPPTGNAAVPRSTRDLLPSIKWGSEVNSRTENVAHGYQGEGPHNELLQQEAAALSVSHQPRQLGDAGGDAPGLVSGEELRGPGVPSLRQRAAIIAFALASNSPGQAVGAARPGIFQSLGRARARVRAGREFLSVGTGASRSCSGAQWQSPPHLTTTFFPSTSTAWAQPEPCFPANLPVPPIDFHSPLSAPGAK
jgi:hypothetical protein